MWRMIFLGVAALAITLFGFSLADGTGGGDLGGSSRILAAETSIEGFTRALAPLDWQFPQNFGQHPDYQTEWWYYTGNLTDADGARYGFQFTIFRRALTPQSTASDSEWRNNQMYMAHFTLSDIGAQRFYHDERYARGSAGLAGATGQPYRVWLEDWQVQALDDEATQTRISAATAEFAIDLVLQQVKPPALQGEGGLSAKSSVAGNASHYYSLTRLETSGTLRVGERTAQVTGLSWKDHEFSTSALGEDAQGWDWFGLIFENDHELMIGQIRMEDGSQEPAFGGLLVYPDGSTRYLNSGDFSITATSTWTSPHTGATYPAGWDVTLNVEPRWRFSITPLQADQELHGANVEYWEGAVEVTGDVQGVGYAELTGYVATMRGRF